MHDIHTNLCIPFAGMPLFNISCFLFPGPSVELEMGILWAQDGLTVCLWKVLFSLTHTQCLAPFIRSVLGAVNLWDSSHVRAIQSERGEFRGGWDLQLSEHIFNSFGGSCWKKICQGCLEEWMISMIGFVWWATVSLQITHLAYKAVFQSISVAWTSLLFEQNPGDFIKGRSILDDVHLKWHRGACVCVCKMNEEQGLCDNLKAAPPLKGHTHMVCPALNHSLSTVTMLAKWDLTRQQILSVKGTGYILPSKENI